MRAGKRFDLNIEKMLEHWTLPHAIREVIANALDEQALTKTLDPAIEQDESGTWHIRDFGRGLRYEHLTQKENREKLRRADEVIGKFGVGLKDALATFDRHRISVRIKSRHADITTILASKHGFEDIRTLHAVVAPPSDPAMEGTDFALTGVGSDHVEEAKGFFLRYAGEETLDATAYGAILRPRTKRARIYVNGLLVAQEENFLFSYNVTSLTAALRRALNRERTNVGRAAYSDRVKAILLASSAPVIAEALGKEVGRFESGGTHDELQWTDVQLHACRILNAASKVVFVTSQQMLLNGKLVEYAKAGGNRVVVVPTALAAKLPGLLDTTGQPIRDLGAFHREWASEFKFNFCRTRETRHR